MAALDIPWMTHMSTPKSSPRVDVDGVATPAADFHTPAYVPPASYAPPTYAAFSPANLSSTAAAKRTSTILVHQKSPLLLATPPQVTRALAYSHPFLLPLNKFVGLVTWTTGDPWESFLLLVVFWVIVQYGDYLVRFVGPIVAVVGIMAGMYARRYSPLSSSGWTEHPSSATATKDKKKASQTASASTSSQASSGHQRNYSEVTSTRHQKTLDEIVDTLKVFISRCNILLEPLLVMTDFLSTQRTATSATTRPALTTLFVRILAVTPFWILLTLPPLRIITTKRVVLVLGTVILSWHSKVCRVTRTLLWRSATVRKVARWVTGLEFQDPVKQEQPKQKDKANGLAAGNASMFKQTDGAIKRSSSVLTEALKRSQLSAKDSGVRFTFILYENQRRWLGLGWTNSLFAYERVAWTDEQNNPVPSKEEFELPEVEDGRAKWQWVAGRKWRVDGLPDMDDADYDTDAGKMGWIFYDNKWQNGRRGVDGWGRWTRRRKWYRDAELIEVPEDDVVAARPQHAKSYSSDMVEASARSSTTSHEGPAEDIINNNNNNKPTAEDDSSVLSSSSKSARFWLPGASLRRRTVVAAGSTPPRPRRTSETASLRSNDDESPLHPALELEIQGRQRDQGQWGIGDDAQMGLE